VQKGLLHLREDERRLLRGGDAALRLGSDAERGDLRGERIGLGLVVARRSVRRSSRSRR
jgi:hypothetical protein